MATIFIFTQQAGGNRSKKMENITLGQVVASTAFLIALIGGWVQLKKWTTTAVKEILKDELKSIKDELKTLHAENAERGQEWSDIERQRFYEQYDHYSHDLNGNTYIETAVKHLEQTGKIWR